MEDGLAGVASSASRDEFPNVFEPLTLRHRTLSARITFGAHTANMAEGGLPGERHIGYYVERAIGGAGMIVVEPVPTHRTAVLTRGNFRHGDDAVIPHFRRLTEAVHEAAGTTIIQQLYHVGQHGDADNSFAPNWSPSGLPSYHDADGSHAVTELEIDELIDGFVAAARRAQQSGFDGVEVFAAYHGLIDQFWTPWSNRRTDRWGGSIENRLRFGRQILEGIRRQCGDEFIVGLAVNVDPESPASMELGEVQEIVGWHDDRQLMDYVTCGTGSYFDFYKLMPTSLYPSRYGEPFAAALKEVVRHAVVQAESHMRTPANAEAALAAGHADLVSIVRGQIADPHLVRKAREGRAGEVRPCISCNQMCWGRRSRDYFISCLVNPSAGREFEYGGDRFTTVEPASRKRVVVVGGGPAGMEAARVAAERGHEVRLFESADQLGGQWRLAGLQPSREQILDHIAWYGRQLERLDVDVRVNTTFEPTDSGWADEIVVATGARPARNGFQRAAPLTDRLPGVDQGNVADITDVLSLARTPSGRVVLVDDLNDWRGIGTALFLQEHGCHVTIATSQSVVAGGLYHSAADVPARTRFARAGGRMMPHTVVAEWRPLHQQAIVRNTLTGRSETVDADWLAVAEVATSNDEMTIALSTWNPSTPLHVIGDAVAPRRAVLAIYEGRQLGMAL
jgi:2,4-dienoyl-CoA reductase-like NADH-dependent reductase (Old Yellow Enzyme family)